MKIFFLILSVLLSFPVFPKPIELKVTSLYKKADRTIKSEFVINTELDKEIIIKPVKQNPLAYKFKLSKLADSVPVQINNKNSLLIEGNISIQTESELNTISNPMLIISYNKEAELIVEGESGEFFNLKILAQESKEL